MPDAKFRRKIQAAGGIDITGTASFSGPIAAGSAGTTFNDILFGSGCVNQPSCLGGGSVVVVGTGSLTTGFSAGDTIVGVPAASLTAGMVLVGLECVSGCVSASWINSASGDNAASAGVEINYIIFS